MSNLNDQIDEVTLLYYKWPKEAEDPSNRRVTYHLECDECQTRFFSTNAMVTHAIMEHKAKKISMVVCD